jgi:ParB family chromosome partitioning protein
MKIAEIKTSEPFKSLFPIENRVLDRVQENMQRHGYDPSQPIVLWIEKGVVVDGHTRLAAAMNLGLKEVLVQERSFANKDEALAYAIHNQRDRRNLSEAELLRCIEAVDKRRKRGGDRRSEDAKSKGANAPIERSAEITANIVGTSPDRVKRARSVLSDPKEKEAVMAGKKSINQASKDANAKRKSKQPLPPPEPYSDAFYFLEIALSQLSRIRKEDPKRVEAVQRLLDWANAELLWSPRVKRNRRKNS